MTETIQLTLFESETSDKGFRKHSSTCKKAMPSDEWFIEEYTVKLRSGNSIANEIECNPYFVYRHLREIGIQVTGRWHPNRIDLSEHHDWINDQYRNGKSLKWLREHFSISYNMPINRELEADIEIRPSQNYVRGNTTPIVDLSGQWVEDAFQHLDDPKYRARLYRFLRKHGHHRILQIIMLTVKMNQSVAIKRQDSKHSAAMKKPEYRAKLREANKGKNNPNFNNWSSRAPYCYNWTEEVREHTRNLYNRICTICGKCIFQYFKIGCKAWACLHVDHLDENKMQGCDDWEWRLAPLCPSCHGKMQIRKIPRHLLLRLLLLNNKKHQVNFLFGDEMQSNKLIEETTCNFRL